MTDIGTAFNMADITLDFSKGTIKQDLADLPEKMLDAAYEALIQQAEVMKALAQIYVRVDTGSLRDSIRIERVTATQHRKTVRVRAGGYVTNPRTKQIVNYAAIIEQQYPFMRPAYEAVKDTIRDMIKQNVVEKVKPR